MQVHRFLQLLLAGQSYPGHAARAQGASSSQQGTRSARCSCTTALKGTVHGKDTRSGRKQRCLEQPFRHAPAPLLLAPFKVLAPFKLLAPLLLAVSDRVTCRLRLRGLCPAAHGKRSAAASTLLPLLPSTAYKHGAS